LKKAKERNQNQDRNLHLCLGGVQKKKNNNKRFFRVIIYKYLRFGCVDVSDEKNNPNEKEEENSRKKFDF